MPFSCAYFDICLLHVVRSSLRHCAKFGIGIQSLPMKRPKVWSRIFLQRYVCYICSTYYLSIYIYVYIYIQYMYNNLICTYLYISTCTYRERERSVLLNKSRCTPPWTGAWSRDRKSQAGRWAAGQPWHHGISLGLNNNRDIMRISFDILNLVSTEMSHCKLLDGLYPQISHWHVEPMTKELAICGLNQSKWSTQSLWFKGGLPWWKPAVSLEK